MKKTFIKALILDSIEKRIFRKLTENEMNELRYMFVNTYGIEYYIPSIICGYFNLKYDSMAPMFY